MKEDRIKSKRQMENNSKNLNIILGEERKKRINKEIEEKIIQDIEMPELERRKIELGILFYKILSNFQLKFSRFPFLVVVNMIKNLFFMIHKF